MASLSQVFTGSRTVAVHALKAGTLTLPADRFIHPCDPGLRISKPSLSFLIQHSDENGKITRVLFDLGIRRVISEYPPEIRGHILTRQPLDADPDVRKSIERGGLTTDEIDLVVLSHVHWDHIGRPKDFQKSVFVVGHGTLQLLHSSASAGSATVSHSHFEPDLLPLNRTIELTQPFHGVTAMSGKTATVLKEDRFIKAKWNPLLESLTGIDIFGDQSMFIVDAPGHLDGHINLLARTGQATWVYLAGDACHDRSLLTGDLDIAEWTDADGRSCCIHADKEAAKQTLRRIRKLEIMYGKEMEVILAHDDEWCNEPENKSRFWPGQL